MMLTLHNANYGMPTLDPMTSMVSFYQGQLIYLSKVVNALRPCFPNLV